ncbi:MAG: hypothetical protein HQM06_13530 [Magnetococcales bacterium]|nr:hypothetical protein [Magnetococcales bacterium]
MEAQHVNFYQDRLRPRTPFLPWQWVVACWLLLAGVLLLGSYGLQTRLEEGKQAVLARQSGVVITPATQSPESAAEAACRSQWQQVAGQEYGSEGMVVTALLEQLAAAHTPGVWLTRVQRVGGQGAEERLELSGLIEGSDEARWQNFVQRLLAQPVLAAYVLREVQRDSAYAPGVAGHKAKTERRHAFRLRLEAGQALERQGQR